MSGTNVEMVFHIYNNGDEPLKISRVVPSCGCTKVKLGANVINHGEHADLQVALSLKSRTGQQLKNVTLQSNDPACPNFVVTISGTATLPIVLSPASISFGTIESNDGPTQTVDIVSNTSSQLNILRVENGDPADMSFDVLELRSGAEFSLSVKLAKSITPGLFKSYIVLVTSDPIAHLIGIPVTANVVGDLIVEPSAIRLKADTELSTISIALRPARVKVFKVLAVDSPVESVSVKQTVNSDGSVVISVSNIYAAKLKHGDAIIIHTDDPQLARIRIPIEMGARSHPPKVGSSTANRDTGL